MAEIMDCSCIAGEYKAEMVAALLHQQWDLEKTLDMARHDIHYPTLPDDKMVDEYIMEKWPDKISRVKTLLNFVESIPDCR